MDEYCDTDANPTNENETFQQFRVADDLQLIPSKDQSKCSKGSSFKWMMLFVGIIVIFGVMIGLFAKTLNEVQQLHDSLDDQTLMFNQTVIHFTTDSAKLQAQIQHQINNNTKLSNKANTLETQLEEIENTANVLETDNTNMQKMISNQLNDMNGLNSRSIKLSQSIEKLTRNTDDLDTKTANLQTEVQTQLNRTDTLQTFAQGLESKMTALESTSEDFRNEINEIQTDQHEMELRFEEERNRTTSLVEQASFLQTNITLIDGEILVLENSTSYLQEEYWSLHSTVNAQVNTTSKLENDIAQLTTETNNLKNRSRYQTECSSASRVPDRGWTAYGRYQYKYFSSSRIWATARTICHNLGGDLAVHGIQSMETRQVLKSILSIIMNSVWIGMSDRDREGTWRWVAPYPYTNGTIATRSTARWSIGEPLERSRYGSLPYDCAKMNPYDLRLASYSCSRSLDFLCEKPL